MAGAGRRPTRSGSTPGTHPRPDPARDVAFEVLRAVSERAAYANLVLPTLLRRRQLAGREAGLATELAYGTLRAEGTYDQVLARCVDRSLAALDPGLLDLLRLGTHQLLALRIPAHAAVSATVDQARAQLGEGPARLVNAVLRRVSQADVEEWMDRLAPVGRTDRLDRLALVHAHPRWVVEAFAEALGGNLDEVELALAADNRAPVVTLAARPGTSARDELLAAGARPGRWSPYAAYSPGGNPAGLVPVADGRARVQDEGSQLVALALAGAPVEGAERRWLDLAAGPGGKASLLGALAAEQGISMVAADRAEHRARLVRRADPSLYAVTADAMRPPWLPGMFDRVLADVPCTGLGALRRRPESRWRRRPEDVLRLAPLQRGLLTAALDAVRPGGLVAYVTCSPHPGETRAVVADVLGDRGDAIRVDAREYLPGVPELGEGPEVQLWPHRHGTDAMFLALLRRR
ncbi:MAG: RsmB/NOP family class I SAM-dependent RNA methyltransferase [Actinomycetes bacterium]